MKSFILINLARISEVTAKIVAHFQTMGIQISMTDRSKKLEVVNFQKAVCYFLTCCAKDNLCFFSKYHFGLNISF